MTSDFSGRSRTSMLPANRANSKKARSRSRKKLRILARRWTREIKFGGAAWADWLGTELMMGCQQINKEGQSSTMTQTLTADNADVTDLHRSERVQPGPFEFVEMRAIGVPSLGEIGFCGQSRATGLSTENAMLFGKTMQSIALRYGTQPGWPV